MVLAAKDFGHVRPDGGIVRVRQFQSFVAFTGSSIMIGRNDVLRQPQDI